jgi:hypothetical protein
VLCRCCIYTWLSGTGPLHTRIPNALVVPHSLLCLFSNSSYGPFPDMLLFRTCSSYYLTIGQFSQQGKAAGLSKEIRKHASHKSLVHLDSSAYKIWRRWCGCGRGMRCGIHHHRKERGAIWPYDHERAKSCFPVMLTEIYSLIRARV